MKRMPSFLALALILSACNSGGGGNNTTSNPTENVNPPVINIPNNPFNNNPFNNGTINNPNGINNFNENEINNFKNTQQEMSSKINNIISDFVRGKLSRDEKHIVEDFFNSLNDTDDMMTSISKALNEQEIEEIIRSENCDLANSKIDILHKAKVMNEISFSKQLDSFRTLIATLMPYVPVHTSHQLKEMLASTEEKSQKINKIIERLKHKLESNPSFLINEIDSFNHSAINLQSVNARRTHGDGVDITLEGNTKFLKEIVLDVLEQIKVLNNDEILKESTYDQLRKFSSELKKNSQFIQKLVDAIKSEIRSIYDNSIGQVDHHLLTRFHDDSANRISSISQHINSRLNNSLTVLDQEISKRLLSSITRLANSLEMNLARQGISNEFSFYMRELGNFERREGEKMFLHYYRNLIEEKHFTKEKAVRELQRNIDKIGNIISNLRKFPETSEMIFNLQQLKDFLIVEVKQQINNLK